STQWNFKLNHIQNPKPQPEVVYPDFSYPVVENIPYSYKSIGWIGHSCSKYTSVETYGSVDKEGGLKTTVPQEGINIIDIDHESIIPTAERRPWRNVLLEIEDENMRREIREAQLAESTKTLSPDPDEIDEFCSQEDLSFNPSASMSMNLKRGSRKKIIPLSKIVELHKVLHQFSAERKGSYNRNVPENLAKETLMECAANAKTSEQWNNVYERMREDVIQDLISKEQRRHSIDCSTDDGILLREEYQTGEKHTKLNLKAHSLDQLPNIGMDLLSSLTWINLSFNDFLTIPPSMLMLKNVIYLNMRNNPLVTLPDDISNLKKLKCFIVSFCCLQDVNPRLFQLHELEILDLSHNELQWLDDECQNLQSLRELSIEGNFIRALPKGFLKLNLTYFQCSSNFLHKAFWRETCPSLIQTLEEMCVNVLLNNGIEKETSLEGLIRKPFQSLRCDYCNSRIPLGGLYTIKPVAEIFGAKNMPILFYLCSTTCRKQLLVSTHIPRFDEDGAALENFPMD
uniref:Leucine rich repeat containing protein n=1 Tax=Clytia hemisphaerica TaxID=252671 RepID=A0A7M6DPW7_9CNID